MSDTKAEPAPTPDLADLQHWTWVLGRAQQMMMEHGLDTVVAMPATPGIPVWADPKNIARAQAEFWGDTMKLWQRFLDPASADPVEENPAHAKDKRFKAPQWREEPVFDFLRQS